MKKRFLSLILALILMISITPIYAEDTAEGITVYFSMSKYGEIVKDKNGNDMAYVALNLSGKSSYILDDAFVAAHAIHYADGTEGYASSEGKWGFGIDKLWGDTSYNFGYQVNGGSESVSGVGHTLKNGDYIDAFIYKNPSIERYARFDLPTAQAYVGKPLELALSYVSGYDENWNNIFSPCEGATITVNSEETEWITDESGNASVTLEDTGIHILSATKETVLNNEQVPAITAPVCVVEVKDPAIQIIHNLAEQYAQSDFAEAGGNLPWILADMAIYQELFPDSASILTTAKREEGLRHIITAASEATAPGDLAKLILALRALGYDAKKVYTETFEAINLVEKLTNLVDDGKTAVTNIYTLPYVMIALSQAEDYASDTQMEWLIQSALESKSAWQSTADGTDAMAPMILALAPYYDNPKVQPVINDTVEILKAEQREDGLIDGFPGYESASTGLAICALSAIGTDAGQVRKEEKSLIDGLLSTANADWNAFSNAFATEQGFRGLLAWRLLLEDKGKTMYDFSEYPMEEANISGAEHCPVLFEVTPADATVKITGHQELSKHCFDLDAGSYTYSVSASGYTTVTDTVRITAEEAENHTAKTVTVTLSKTFTGGGAASSGPVFYQPDDTDTEEVPKTEEEQNTVSDATFPDVSRDEWYYPSVQYVYKNNLFLGTDQGFEPDTAMTRAMLVTVLCRLASPADPSGSNPFQDVTEGMWYTESVKWAAENGIISGVSQTEFSPDADITREQLAVILYRYALLCGYDTSIGESTNILSYSDFEKISEYALHAIRYVVALGVMTGRTEDMIVPEGTATRAEVATMLMRFSEVKK